jgi:hypothetical protein
MNMDRGRKEKIKIFLFFFIPYLLSYSSFPGEGVLKKKKGIKG